MPLPNHFPLSTIIVLLLGDVARGQSGFDYCAPPVAPTCIEQASRSRSQADIRSCGPRVLRFTQSLGAYRVCLQRESEHAVEAGNEAIARFRCLALGQSSCSPEPKETER